VEKVIVFVPVPAPPTMAMPSLRTPAPLGGALSTVPPVN